MVDNRWTAIAVFFFCSVWPTLVAGPSRADGQTEIDHLMQFIETSDCMFDRNGSLYGSREAGAHIRKKYAHAQRWVETAEDFIRYAATKSSLSGRPYRVICHGVDRPTAEWLAAELSRLRKTTTDRRHPD